VPRVNFCLDSVSRSVNFFLDRHNSIGPGVDFCLDWHRRAGYRVRKRTGSNRYLLAVAKKNTAPTDSGQDRRWKLYSGC
jgi:hypothetical protein